MTNWVEWNGGECPLKSDDTLFQVKLVGGKIATPTRGCHRLDWEYGGTGTIIAYRIIEDHEPKMTREQITAQIEALQKQLDAMPVVERRWFHNGSIFPFHEPHFKNYFDIETINGVPHIHGVAMKEVVK
jgi:hypothetical protein